MSTSTPAAPPAVPPAGLRVPAPRRTAAEPLRIASVPAGHAYVRHLSREVGPAPHRLPDPERLPEGGTRVTYRAEFRTHGAAKLAEPLLPPGLKILGDKVAASMQEHLDALDASATTADGSGV